jgi:hypothetical protein
MKAFVVAFCGILLAAPALAEPSATAGNSGAGATAPSAAPESANRNGDHARDPQHQICRRIDSDVSRRIGSRLVCHTAEEWRELQNGS